MGKKSAGRNKRAGSKATKKNVTAGSERTQLIFAEGAAVKALANVAPTKIASGGYKGRM